MFDRSSFLRGGRAALRVAFSLALCAFMLTSVGCSGGPEEEQTELDLSGQGITDITELTEKTSLRELDLRDNELTVEQFFELSKALPECRILWSVPIAGTRIDSCAQTLELSGRTLSAEDISLLTCFTDVQSADFTGGGLTFEQGARVCSLLGDDKVRWDVPLTDDLCVEYNASVLDLASTPLEDAVPLISALKYLPNVTRVELDGSGLDNEKCKAVRDAFPEKAVAWTVELGGERLRSDAEVVDLSAAEAITDISALQYIENASEVRLHGSGIADLSALGGLKKLRKLYLSDMPDVDLAYVGGLSELRELYIYNSALTSIAPLAPLTELEILDVSGNKLTSLKAVEGMTKLRELYVGLNKLKDFKALSSLNNLELIFARENRITSLSPIKQNTKLRELDVAGNKLRSVSALKNMTELNALFLQYNDISDIDALEGMTKLETLDVSGNAKLSSLKPIAGCTALKFLGADDTDFYTVGQLEELTGLEYLSLPNNSLVGIFAVAKLEKLSELHLHRNRISAENLERLQQMLPECNIVY